MKTWFISLNGAIALSIITLVSNLWHGSLDAMFVMPIVYSGETMLNLASVIFTVIFVGWSWSLLSAGRGSQSGIIAAFAVNLVVLLAVPIRWLIVYCPADCRADAGIFNLANTLNLVFGVLAAISLGIQLLPAKRNQSIGAAHG